MKKAGTVFGACTFVYKLFLENSYFQTIITSARVFTGVSVWEQM